MAKAATFAPVVPTCAQGPLLEGARSILKPSSFVELSVQVRSISLEDVAAAFSELGSAGGEPAPGVGVRVTVGVAVGVLVGNPVVGVRVGVAVDATGVGVRVGVTVCVGVRVAVGDGVGVAANVVADAVLE